VTLHGGGGCPRGQGGDRPHDRRHGRAGPGAPARGRRRVRRHRLRRDRRRRP
jgi:hypothetical protein